jgi:MFS transporter, DHA2 family, multidrug resistance protein
MNETGAELGFALGIASLGSLGIAVYRHELADGVPSTVPAEVARTASETLAAAAGAAGSLSEPAATELLTAARAAFTSGMHVVAAVCAVLLIGVAVLATTLLRHVPPSGASEP